MHKKLREKIIEAILDDKKLDIDALSIEYGVEPRDISPYMLEYRTQAAKSFDNASKELDKVISLIGKHPKSEIFFDWCKCEDTVTTTKKHRNLKDLGIDRSTLIEKISNWIINHHAPLKQIKRFKKKKSILNKHDFKEYVTKRMPFPIKNFATQKGNLGEILLAEYLKSSSGLELLVYKLRFNPNVEQSMKGDDILLFDKNNIENKIIMGEAKYRTKPDKLVIDDIMHALSKDHLPISLSFVRDRLDELNKEEVSEQVDKLISDIYKKSIPIVYVGFLHSNHNVGNQVEKHLNSDNENLVFISYGERNPEKLIKKSFEKAIEKITS